MPNATSVAARPRLTALGASFGARLPFVFLGAAFFLAAMVVLLAFGTENDARPARVREIGPGPVDEHDEPAAELDQEVDVQHQPEPPGKNSGEPQGRQLHDGGVTPDRGQRAQVTIVEGGSRTLRQQRRDVARHLRAPLLRGLRHAWYRLAVLLHAGEIARNEHLRMPWKAKVGGDLHASGTIELGA